MALKDVQPPAEEKSQKEKKTRSTRQSPRKGSELDRIRKGLTELFETVGSGQQMLGVAIGEPRHYVGGKVTEELGPRMVDAWVNLAETSPMVRRYLLRMTEGTAYGEVIFATIGFTYSQAQAYGAIPIEFGNAWIDLEDILPPSPEVAKHQAGSGRVVPDMGEPIVPDAPPTPEPEEVMSEAEVAEQERKRIEERRKFRKGPVVET